MPAESTRGLGQGAAQVFDTSGLANIYARKVANKAEKQADLTKRITEVAGMADDVFKEKYFATRDDGYIRNLYGEIQNKYKGKWANVANVGSEDYLNYKNDVQNMLFTARQSEESKTLANPVINDMRINKYEYEPESLQYMEEFLNTPGMVFDSNRISKINSFDIDKDFNEGLSVYREGVKLKRTKDTYGEGDNGIFVNKKTTQSTEEDEDEYMASWLRSLQTNYAAVDKINREYGAEAARLTAAGQPTTVWDILYTKKKKDLKIDLMDVSASKSGGEGKQKPFNPANIVEDFDLKTQTEGETPEYFKGLEVFGFKPSPIVKSQKTKMYQTGKITAVIPISKGVIDMDNDKEFSEVGTYSVEMGSPLVYNNKLMVPAIVKGIKAEGGGEYHQSVLIPAEDVQQQFMEQEGTDLSQVANQFKVPFKGKTTTTNKSTTAALKKGDTKTLSSGRKVIYNGSQWVAQ